MYVNKIAEKMKWNSVRQEKREKQERVRRVGQREEIENKVS